MDSFLESLIKGEVPKQSDIEEYFSDICEREHGSCNNECPVFAVTHSVPNNTNSGYGCDCFKSGKAMIKYLKKHLEEMRNRH